MDRTTAIGTLAYALAPGNLDRLDGLLPRIIPAPMPPNVAYEIVLQSHLFFGYAQTLEALRIFSKSVNGGGTNDWRRDDNINDSQGFRRRGEELCQAIYRGNHQRLLDEIKQLSPELTEWMITDAYGKVLSRPGPTAQEREIASIVFLVCSGHPVQLYSHVRGARNLGATARYIASAISESGLSPQQLEFVGSTIAKVFQL